MTINKSRWFIHFGIAILFCVHLNELTYTSTFVEEVFQPQLLEDNQTFMRYQTKYAAIVGETNNTEEVAWKLFEKKYFPQLFKTCTSGDKRRHHTALRLEERIETPREDFWGNVLFGADVHYVPYLKYLSFVKLEYSTKILNSNNEGIWVSIELLGLQEGHERWNKIGNFQLLIDYNLENIIDIQCTENSEMLPLFGGGVLPKKDCSYLLTNTGKIIK